MQSHLIEPPRDNGRPVKQERTFWRDMKLLKRHRDWGFDVPAEDIDFLEYDKRKAVALFEYKMVANLENISLTETDANLMALVDLANRANLPIFCTFYNSTRKWFRVLSLNELAVKEKPPEGLLPEHEYVRFLYWLRDRDMPEFIRDKLW